MNTIKHLKLTEQQRSEVNERLKSMYVDYERYSKMNPIDIGSNGMIAGYSLTGGGRSGKITDLTASTAIRIMSVPPEVRLRIQWLEVTMRIYQRGISEALNHSRISHNERMRRATISYLLYYRAFRGYTMQRIIDMPLPSGGKPGRGRIYEMWNLAVENVGCEAKKEGLL